MWTRAEIHFLEVEDCSIACDQDLKSGQMFIDIVTLDEAEDNVINVCRDTNDYFLIHQETHLL